MTTTPISKPRWYFVQVASGCEQVVKSTLHQRSAVLHVTDRILDIAIPETTVTKTTKAGNRKPIQQKLYPGYVLVHMHLDAESVMAVRTTPNVINFVGAAESNKVGAKRSHIKPKPLTHKEVKAIFNVEPAVAVKQITIDAQPGDQIEVTSGPFKSFKGEIISLNDGGKKLKALLEIFGRETPVELEASQINILNSV